MSKFNALLTRRFKTEKKEKVSSLVQRSTSGQLSSFSGIFQVPAISQREQTRLENLLKKYQTKQSDLKADLVTISALTCEVKAISSQAIILHGQRIKQVGEILKKYRDGAFSSWLIHTYGNRQTPYNFLQYFELYSSLPDPLKKRVDDMPRQAIYSLSSRSIPQVEKIAFIKNYQGETKKQLLEKLRLAYPLSKQDKRQPNRVKTVFDYLQSALTVVRDKHFHLNSKEKKELTDLVETLIEELTTR